MLCAAKPWAHVGMSVAVTNIGRKRGFPEKT